MRVWVLGGVVLSLAVATFALVRIAGEMHLQNCLDRVGLEFPASYSLERDGLFYDGEVTIGPVPRGEVEEWDSEDFAFYKRRERDAALAACSRWP